jgi:hypothetical protein
MSLDALIYNSFILYGESKDRRAIYFNGGF